MKSVRPHLLLAREAVLSALVVSTTPFIFACSGSSSSVASSGSSTAVAMSGTLSATSSSLIGKNNVSKLKGGVHRSTTDYSGYTVDCITSDVPPVEVKSTVSTTGTFSLSITDGLDKGVSCNILDSSDAIVAALELSDSTNKDMNGNSSVNDSLTFSDTTAKLGTVSLDTTTGDASVSSDQITNSSGASAVSTTKVTAAEAFDPTGVWTIAAVDFTLPKGVSGPVTGDGNGPPTGQKLYLNRLVGVSTVDQSTVFGMQVWQDSTGGGDPKAAMDACGDMTGLSAADASTAQVDLTSYGAKNGAFAFTTAITDSHVGTDGTVTDGYKLSTAKAPFTMQNCFPKSITSNSKTYNAYVCGPDTAGNSSPGGRYQAGLDGGCTDSDGNAVNISDWSSVTWTGNPTSSSSTVSGFFTNSQTGTYNSKTITCTNTFGVFDNADLTTASSGGTASNPPPFNWSSLTNIMTADVTLCSSLSAHPLLQAQCYANYYEDHKGDVTAVGGGKVCLPRVNMDWTATDAASFAQADFRPDSLVFEEKLSYSDSTHASMLTVQTNYQGVQQQDSSGHQTWINCKVTEKGGLQFKQVSDTKILATYVSSTTTASVDIPACVANFGSTNEKFMFYLTK